VKHYLTVRAAIAALVATVALPLAASAQTPRCNAQLDQVRFANPLGHVGAKLTAGQPITIVAIGSSSTAGAGASSPAATYPSRLQAELRDRFKDMPINVINRGVNGEEVPDMLKRFDQSVIAAKPDLVIWQLGTNSVIRDHKLSDHGALVHAGIEKIRASGADVILIDPQYAPKVIVKPDASRMVELIGVIAKEEDVDLYPRFQVMRRWHDAEQMDFKVFVSADGLHMNDWSYACLAKGLGLAIAEAAQRPVLSVSAHAYAD
jgi:lysophospholipase L1-like esterase